MNWKRMLISLVVAALFGLFCAYGTSTVKIEGFEITLWYLAVVFYSRLLIGFAIGLADHVRLIGGDLKNAALRGAIIGAIVSVELMIPGGFGAAIFVVFGIIYGAITDVLATKFCGARTF